ncbi:MAG: hypothetical protein ACYTEQ_01030 [Planctomycetota bacterium]|jgi:hypothetical protein
MSDTHKKTAVVDLDNTLAEYDVWRGPEHIGAPVPYAWEALKEMQEWGWHIVVFTTRGDHNLVVAWLIANEMPFDAVNSTKHNPPGTSHKPIGEVYFDDRDCHVVGETPYNWRKAMRRVRRRYQPPKDTFIDDAAFWGDNFLSFLQRPKHKRRKIGEECCPVCGYFCLGKGGMGCIDKPTMQPSVD